MTTPAQAYGHPTLNDVPVQGPTDPGLRADDCRYVQTNLPQTKACIDCEGTIPMWAKTTTVRGPGPGIGGISFGRSGVIGFALEAAGDPDVWTKLSAAQQAWVMNALIKLDAKIRETTQSTCKTFGPSITAAGGCFQGWYNVNYAGPGGPSRALRGDGVFDDDTLCALIMVVNMHPADFPVPFPDPEKKYCQVPGSSAQTQTKKGLSTASMFGIGAVVATAGGLIYAATSGKKTGRRRR